jgi:hypothetical protein
MVFIVRPYPCQTPNLGPRKPDFTGFLTASLRRPQAFPRILTLQEEGVIPSFFLRRGLRPDFFDFLQYFIYFLPFSPHNRG